MSRRRSSRSNREGGRRRPERGQVAGPPGQRPGSVSRHKGPFPPAALWEADVVPVPARIRSDPAARVAIPMAAIGPYLGTGELVGRCSGEPEDIATMLDDMVTGLVEQGNREPTRIVVRFEEVAGPLADRLSGRQIQVAARRKLPALDRAVSLFYEEHGGLPGVSTALVDTERWAAWRLPDEEVRSLFAAAATFHEKAPWRRIDNEQVLICEHPEVGEWYVSVMGAGAQVFGLSLHERREDLQHLLTGDYEGYVRGLEGAVISLELNREAPRRMVNEAKEAQWTLAGPGIVPVLYILRTPGGGISRARAKFLTGLLEELPEAIEGWDSSLSSGELPEPPLHARLPQSGIRVAYRGVLRSRSRRRRR